MAPSTNEGFQLEYFSLPEPLHALTSPTSAKVQEEKIQAKEMDGKLTHSFYLVSPGSLHSSPDLHPSRSVEADTDDELEYGLDEEENDANGGFTPPEGRAEPGEDEEDADGFLARDLQRRTTHYDLAAEKSMSHQEAKQFYQRHKLEHEDSHGSPLMRAKTLRAEDEKLSRAGSIRSKHGNELGRRRETIADPPHGYKESPKLEEAESNHKRADFVQPDKAIRKDAKHPDMPHESKPPALSMEGINGAGAGVGLGCGAGGFAASDAQITEELRSIYTKIQKVLDFRHKYIRLSLQGPDDNPKDEPSWPIYPPPPDPSWDHDRPSTSLSNSMAMNKDGTAEPPLPRRTRKLGQDIGEDFVLEDLLPLPEASEMIFELDESGVYQVYETSEAADHGTPIVAIPTLRDYYMNLELILEVAADGPSKSFAYRRLQFLDGKYNLFNLVNEYQEVADSKKVPHRDFYNVRKVDTHVHHSACMNQKHLLRFIKSKIKKFPDEIVLFRDDKYLTLEEVFESIGLSAYDLSIDTLDMHAHTDSFHRFDKFNLKYNPIGESRLRTIFLKTDNHIKGRYLAELTKEVMSDLEASKYQMVEWRISIYGRELCEWDKLAAWVVDNKLFSPNVRWLIQVPRLFDVYKSTKLMDNFEEVLINIFKPLYEVTQDPTSHPKLHILLQRVIGFDSVDDESKIERRLYRKFPTPRDWTTKQNPPYSYWIYYLFANIASLNVWRKHRGFNTFVLRPHCGEAGDSDHLAAAVLCCHSISHGILLRKVPLLQYIFYLEQIGIAMSPLSNNALFLNYERNPFLAYFRRGLNVSLSTDDPLQFAYTKEPLIEEYAVAAQIYKLSPVDMCELAKHSVVQSGFEHSMKQRWLGNDYRLPGVAGNDVAKVNVPDIREGYRHETLMQELAMIERYTQQSHPLVGESLPQGSSDLSRTSTVQAGSPTASRMTDPSASGLADLYLPQSGAPYPPPSVAQTARLNQSYSTNDIATLINRTTTPTSGLDRSSSLTFPQPNHSYTTPQSPSRHRSESIVNINGSEPRMFPGIVMSRTRRSSVQRASVDLSDGGASHGLGWGRKSEVGGSVIEEDDDTSPAKTPTEKNDIKGM